MKSVQLVAALAVVMGTVGCVGHFNPRHLPLRTHEDALAAAADELERGCVIAAGLTTAFFSRSYAIERTGERSVIVWSHLVNIVGARMNSGIECVRAAGDVWLFDSIAWRRPKPTSKTDEPKCCAKSRNEFTSISLVHINSAWRQDRERRAGLDAD